ncbi:MAG TPA: hypothetical protein PLV92_28500, partial [Pirellulaceae bacterium]|nr:hypothetical protein [Pirellulaceae bacterium]
LVGFETGTLEGWTVEPVVLLEPAAKPADTPLDNKKSDEPKPDDKPTDASLDGEKKADIPKN